MSDDLISKENPTTKGIDKIKVSSAEIVVHGTKEKPYYEIKYFDLSDNEIHIGFSSYKLDIVFEYLEKYFEIVNEKEHSDQSRDHRSGDLISRKASLEIINYFFAHTGDGMPEHYAYGVVLNELKAVPTAFDKEKVIEELKEEGCIVDDEAGNRAVEIVEKGGIESSRRGK